MIIAISTKNNFNSHQMARIALLNAGQLMEYSVWKFDQPGDVGDVFSGRVITRVPSMAGSFVDLGSMTGFLPDSAGGAALSEGNYLATEIIRSAQCGKGPRVAALGGQVDQKTGIIRQSLGPLIDISVRFPDASIFLDDYHLIASILDRCRHLPIADLRGRMSFKAVTFDPALEDEVATLAEPTVNLSSGARMQIAITQALTAIDIDAGSATYSKYSKPHSHFDLNSSLIPEISRQILLRNLSGAIVIDFIGMKSATRSRLLGPLCAALKADPLHPTCLGFSHLGFAEISRPRIRPPLCEFLQ